MKKEFIARLNTLAEELYYDYEVVGIRVQEEPFRLGEMDHVSHIWDDGEDTGEELDGVCTVSSTVADRVFKMLDYYGEHVAIIAGNEYRWGQDYGEIIIRDPVVVEILA